MGLLGLYPGGVSGGGGAADSGVEVVALATVKASLSSYADGDLVVTDEGVYYVAVTGSVRTLLPLAPYGPGRGKIIGAVRLGVWAASGDNTDFGDFSRTKNNGTTSVTDDGDLITVQVSGASCEINFLGPTLTDADEDVIVVAKDWRYVDYPTSAEYSTASEWACFLWSGAYISGSSAATMQVRPVPNTDSVTGIDSDEVGFYTARGDDTSGTPIQRSTGIEVTVAEPSDLYIAASSRTGRLGSIQYAGIQAVATEGDDAQGILFDMQCEVNPTTAACFFEVGPGNAGTSGINSVAFTALEVWRVTVEA